MQRLCGRPGCSEVAAVAYGMRAEDLVFWLDALTDDADAGAAVLCRRHADSMVVPRGWTLDDLRDPDLHLFRPPLPAPAPRTRAPRRPRERPVVEQLQLGAEPEVPLPPPPPSVPPTADPASEPADAVLDSEHPLRTESDVRSGDDDPGPWTPAFDEADDLDGLLAARSPLLSRAFRTADRRDD
jgi:hypothetical protein